MRFLLPLLLSLPLWAMGQSSAYTVSGTVTDPEGEPLSRASVMVLLASDTTLVAFGMADDQGAFTIDKVPQGEHLLKVTYVGSLPLLLELRPEGRARVDMGTLVLEAIAKDLFEVVVREAKAPMSIRGDTIEYDARKFKVPPGSTVEDLLRRLPGMEVKRDGTLLSEGQEVRRVTVDGRRFFGDDPQAAIKNLPAEGISKVQVFSGESEEQKITGLSSTSPEKTMNLELEDDFKKGGFGKVIAGGGTEDRAELKGMYSRFSPKMQLSVIGMGNNTGRNGMDWDDYQDFRGSQTMSMGSGGDFGFGGDGDMYFIFGGGGDDDIFQRGSFFGGGGTGIPRNASGGINFSRFNDRTEFHGVYYFNHNRNLAESTASRQTFLPEGSFLNATTDRNERSQNAHQLNLRLEHKIDSFQTLSAQINSVSAYRTALQGSASRFLRPDATLSTATDLDVNQDQDDLGANGSLIYSRKYRNEGRRSAWSMSYGYDQARQEGEQFSESRFYDPEGLPDSLAQIRQNTDTRSTREMIKSSLLHVEPLGGNFFSQSFYNYSRRVNGSDRDVWDVENGTLTANDLLTRYYDATMQVHRLGTSLRYARQGLNVTLGLAGQRYLLDGSLQAGPSAGIDTSISRRFDNWIPKFSISDSRKRNRWMNLDYSVNAREPSIRNLQPVVDNSNPLYIRVGNPDLIPQIDHRIGGFFRQSNPLRFTTFYANVSYSLTENQFVQEQTVDSLLVTTARTVNYRGGRRFRSAVGYNFPIVKNKLTVDVDYDLTLGRQFALVNGVENATRSIGHGAGMELQVNPSEFLTASLSARIDWEDIAYSVQRSQDQQLLNQSYSLDLSARLFWSIFLHTNFSYERWRNDRFGVDRDLPLLHASLSRVLDPASRWELRLSVYDVFDRNLAISQSASGNLVSESRTQILTRYAMLSLTYNLRGISTDLKGDKMW